MIPKPPRFRMRVDPRDVPCAMPAAEQVAPGRRVVEIAPTDVIDERWRRGAAEHVWWEG